MYERSGSLLATRAAENGKIVAVLVRANSLTQSFIFLLLPLLKKSVQIESSAWLRLFISITNYMSRHIKRQSESLGQEDGQFQRGQASSIHKQSSWSEKGRRRNLFIYIDPFQASSSWEEINLKEKKEILLVRTSVASRIWLSKAQRRIT